ncbi:MAG: SAM-dependent methyltransferase [Calditrichaeota bacterium]|nr:MAG: SAM-dependent methyltransferase [Calditrichota bacterium]
MTKDYKKNSASFRDPSGFVFTSDGNVFRQVNQSYKENFDLLNSSGLLKKLTTENLLIKHTDSDLTPPQPDIAYKIIQPEKLDFISYPYEWSFSMLKDAALTTLTIQKIALEHGMSLKDASAYNIQFANGKPIFIDTLSFEKYSEGSPWVAYKQFCQHFLAPLALMAYKDIRLNALLKEYIDGIPLDLTSKLLPVKTKFKFSLLTHIHLHAKSQTHYADKPVKHTSRKISKQALTGIVDSLTKAIHNLNLNRQSTEWGKYYENTNYSEKSFLHKKELVKKFVSDTNPQSVFDLGANDGHFSRIASDNKRVVYACDIDPNAVEKNYVTCKSENNRYITPLLLNLTNPSPAIGWANEERESFIKRANTDCLLALALIHHLAISNNLPFEKISDMFASLTSSYLIIEFVPKSDSQVQILLSSREDIFTDYDLNTFELTFSNRFEILKKEHINESDRILYLMKKK